MGLLVDSAETCSQCRGIDIDQALLEASRGKEYKYNHYYGFDALRASAMAGCKLCDFIFRSATRECESSLFYGPLHEGGPGYDGQIEVSCDNRYERATICISGGEEKKRSCVTAFDVVATQGSCESSLDATYQCKALIAA
jgi:hypothetical protein